LIPGQIGGTAEYLLASSGLFLLRERWVCLNGKDGGGNGVAGGSNRLVAEEVRAVRAVPVGVGSGGGGLREARKVPWGGAGATGEGFGGRGFHLAAHAEPFWVTWKLCHLCQTNELSD